MTQLNRRSVLAVLICSHAIYNLALIPFLNYLGDERAQYIAPSMIGALLGQFGILAACFAWGPRYPLTRCLTYCFLATLFWYTLASGAASTGNFISVGSIEALLAICAAMLFATVPLPYWLIRVISPRRLVLPQGDACRVKTASEQFSLQNLLIWTGGSAVVLLIGTSSVGREVWSHLGMSDGDFRGLLFANLVIASLCVLVAIPAAWAVLGHGNPDRALFFLVVYTAILSATEGSILVAMSSERYGWMIIGLNLGILVHVTACSLLLRAVGYRYA